MKPILMLASCGTAAAVVASLVTVVYTRGQSEPSAPAAAPTVDLAPASEDSQAALLPYRINLETWQITTVDGVPVEGDLNSPQAIESRHLANMAAVDPDQYEQLFPKSAAELAAMANALQEIQNPKSLQQRLAEVKDPTELAKWTAALEAISHPVPLTDEMIQTAIRNDPKGPWAILRNR